MSAAPAATHDEHVLGPSKDELRDGFKQLWRLEWITLIYQVAAAAIVFYVAGSSQAMKTEWLENALATIPVAGVLLTYHTENRKPEQRHPFGHHRYATIAFVAAAFVLALLGTYLGYEALTKLLTHEAPSIGGYTAFGFTFWHGWLMIGVMAISALPPVLLARAKFPVARLLHDKPLYADAEMNRANWMTNGAGMIGLGLVASGFWWGDAAAALILSADIMRDGWTNVARSLSDVLDHHPVDLERNQEDPIVAAVHRTLRALPFVADERLLMREHGRYLYAEIFIKPNGHMPPVCVASRTVRVAVTALEWRLQHVVVEFTDDLAGASAVLTREQLDIEPM